MTSPCEEAPMMLDQMESASESAPMTAPRRFPRLGKVVAGVALMVAALAFCAVAKGYMKSRNLITSSVGSAVMLDVCEGSTDQEKCDNWCNSFNGDDDPPEPGCELTDDEDSNWHNTYAYCKNGKATQCHIMDGVEGSCFPGTAVVHVEGTGEVPVKSVRVGDSVLVGSSKGMPVYEPVLSFLHVVESKGLEDNYVVVDHVKGQLRVSPMHLVFVSGGATKRAADLMSGDELVTANAKTSLVLGVKAARGKVGMYAPLTASGKVVVDGVCASNYANVASHPLAHAFFFFVRMYHQLGLDTLFPVSEGATAETDRVHPWPAMLHNKYFKVDEFMGFSK